MAGLKTGQGLTAGNAPIVDGNGVMLSQFRQLILSLINRTGGSSGADITEVQATADAALVSANASAKKAANGSDFTDKPQVRTNLGLGSVALGNTVTGWANPTGVGSRASIDANWTTTVSATYSQSEVTAMRDQIVALQKALAQVILDNKTAKVLS